MSTEAQNAANLANAQHSTGPRTEEGKASSSRNSLKHGLTAKTVLLSGEDPAEYQALSAGMLKDLDPANTMETALARELVDLQWRLLRVSRLEVDILSANPPDFKALNNLSLYSSRMKRQFSATIQELQHLQKTHQKLRKSQLKEAEQIYQADQILQRPSTLAEFGFDFTPEYFETHIRRKEGLHAADQTIAEYKYPFPDEDDDWEEEESAGAESAELDDAA